MDTLHTAYAAAGLLAVVLVLTSRALRGYPVTEPLLALVLGALLGPAALGALVIPQEVRTPLLLKMTRALLALSLMGVALRFPVRGLRSIGRPVVLLVLLVMPVTAVFGALAALLLGLPIALAALLGACLSQADPVLGSGVVTGEPPEKALPVRLRQVLTEESGFNDGVALPLVLIALAPALGRATSGEVGKAAYQVVAGAVIGAAIGWFTGRAVRHVEKQDEVDGPPELILTLLLALAVVGVGRILNSDGVLAVFVAGLLYNTAIPGRDRKKQRARRGLQPLPHRPGVPDDRPRAPVR